MALRTLQFTEFAEIPSLEVFRTCLGLHYVVVFWMQTGVNMLGTICCQSVLAFNLTLSFLVFQAISHPLIGVVGPRKTSKLRACGLFSRFQLQLSRQPSDTLFGRLDREKDRGTFTVINLAKVASVAAQGAHTKHIEVAPGISFNLGAHEPPEQGDSKAMGLAQWLLNLRILSNCYSIIGVRKVATSPNSESMWCSWQVVSYFVDTLTDLATANILGTKMRPTIGVLQLAELNLRTRVVELLRLGAEGGCLTFDDAFNKAFIEKQSLFHCALSPQTQVSTVAKASVRQTQKRVADSRTSDRQARRKADSQSAEPRPRPQYSKYTPDGTLICPDYNTRGCSLSKCWYKSLNAVHCCDVWGCYKEHPRWDH